MVFLMVFNYYRFFNNTDYCTISMINIDEYNIKLKIAKPRKLIFYSDHYMKKTEIYGKTTLHLRFAMCSQKNI